MARLIISFLVLFTFFSCQNNQQEKTLTGVRELDGLKVPEGFSIESIVDPKLITYPMFGSFDETGRLFLFESDGSTPTTEEMLKKPSYHVRMLTDTNSDGIFDKSIIFADSLTFPKGGIFYKGSLYVTSSPDYFRLTDTDSNGVADKKEIIHSGWKLDHNGAILGGPFMGPDGWMYLTDARRGFDITTKEGKQLSGKGARIWRCRPDGSGLEPILGGGYDNAIELVFMPGGETIGTMTYFLDPQGGLRDALMHWVEGGVYPKPHSVIQEDKLKLTGDLMPVMTKLARVAPSGIMRYSGTAFGKEYKGNLFSAEFNTGKIIRSIITADGATFKTTDEPFITSAASDVHPTDVFEDADGSMIIINTGGWFIAGCPLSRVAKLDVPGGIYRIRKTDAEKINDPWGTQIDFNKSTADELASLVKDQRIFVGNKATEHLVDLKNNALPSIMQHLLSSEDESVRAAAVFILGRIGTEEALKEVRISLADTGSIVKTAAARVVGLAKDRNAVDHLKKLLGQDNLAVRRQAAIAIEQINDAGGAQSLLGAASLKNDRYAEHAIIHALTMLNNPVPVINALGNSSAGMRRAAIIALDQMDGNVIQKQHVIPFLENSDKQLEKTGIWVASHHKEWGDVVVNYLSRNINSGNLSEKTDLFDLIIAFSDNKDVQKFIAYRLADDSVTKENKIFFLNVISNSTVKNVPSSWIAGIKKLLNSDDYGIRSHTLAVIQSRGIKELNGHLQQIAFDHSAPPDLKLKAINARLSSDPKLDTREFEMVLVMLDNKYEIPVRQQASRIMNTAELSNAQLLVLSKEMAKADVHLLPNLVNSFEEGKDAKVGAAFVAALSGAPDKLDNISEQDVERVIKEYPESVKQSAQPLISTLRQKNAERLSQLQNTEASLEKGDIGAGRRLFFGKATCSSCHAITNEGNTFAPDLTNIGEIRSRHDILEAIMFPSTSFAREYETSKIVTKTNTYTGIIREQYPDAIVMATGPGSIVRIHRNEILSIEAGTASLMPPGLEKQLTQQELSDLVAYLVSLPDGASGTIGY